jgi:hypothetical protein
MNPDFIPASLKSARDIAAQRLDVASAVIWLPSYEEIAKGSARLEPTLEVTILPGTNASRVKADLVALGLHCIGSGWVNTGPKLTFVAR